MAKILPTSKAPHLPAAAGAGTERGERGERAEGAENTLKTLRFPREFCELRVLERRGGGVLDRIYRINRIAAGGGYLPSPIPYLLSPICAPPGARCGAGFNAEKQRRREAESFRVGAGHRRRRISPISNLLSPISYLREAHGAGLVLNAEAQRRRERRAF